MRVSTFLALCGVSTGVVTRRPADISDLSAVAQFASSAADMFLDAAKALPSAAEAQAALAAQDEKEMHAMLAADAEEEGSAMTFASGFLETPSSEPLVANVRFVEPGGTMLRGAVNAHKSLDAALAALEARQQASEARVGAALGSASDWVRQLGLASA